MDEGSRCFLLGVLCGAFPVLWFLWAVYDRAKDNIKWERQKRDLEVQTVREYWQQVCRELEIMREVKNGKD